MARPRPWRGREFVHVCIDSHAAFPQVLANDKTRSAVAFPEAAIRTTQALASPSAASPPSTIRATGPGSSPEPAAIPGPSIRARPPPGKHKRQGRTLHPDRAQKMGPVPPISRLGLPEDSPSRLHSWRRAGQTDSPSSAEHAKPDRACMEPHRGRRDATKDGGNEREEQKGRSARR